MYRRSAYFAFAFFIACFTPWGRGAKAATPTQPVPECPKIYRMWPSDAGGYVVVFSSQTPQRAAFSFQVFGKRNAYAFTLDHVVMDKPTGDAFSPFRSGPTIFTNPDAGPLGAYAVDVKPELPAACSTARGSLPTSEQSGTFPLHAKKPAWTPLTRDIASESAALQTVVTPAQQPGILVPTCATPFADARIVKLVQPPYPPAAAERGATGSVRLTVSLSETGKVESATIASSSGNDDLDAAALQAARRSSYAPSIFFCTPYADTYAFRADFAP